jgi:hypothetical protein
MVSGERISAHKGALREFTRNPFRPALPCPLWFNNVHPERKIQDTGDLDSTKEDLRARNGNNKTKTEETRREEESRTSTNRFCCWKTVLKRRQRKPCLSSEHSMAFNSAPYEIGCSKA